MNIPVNICIYKNWNITQEKRKYSKLADKFFLLPGLINQCFPTVFMMKPGKTKIISVSWQQPHVHQMNTASSGKPPRRKNVKVGHLNIKKTQNNPIKNKGKKKKTTKLSGILSPFNVKETERQNQGYTS